MVRTGISDAAIIKCIVAKGAESRRDLCNYLGLSKGAVTQIVNRLIQKGFIVEGERFNDSKLGRKTIRLKIRPDIAYFLGTDIEGLAVRACLLDCEKNVIASGKRSVGPKWSKNRISHQWLSLIDDVITKSNVHKNEIVCMGVGLPGVVAKDGFETRAYLPPGQWIDFNTSEVLEKVGLPIAATNNVVCVSEYERRFGIAKNCDDFISLLIRYGIGASIYSGGSAAKGQVKLTGEFGHMRIDLKGPKCICGQRGCLDVFASGRSWTAGNLKSHAVLSRQLKTRGRYIGIGLANLLKIFQPPLVIVNGIYNEYENLIKPVIIATLSDELGRLNLSVPKVVFGEPIELKTSIGAAMQAVDVFLEQFLKV